MSATHSKRMSCKQHRKEDTKALDSLVTDHPVAPKCKGSGMWRVKTVLLYECVGHVAIQPTHLFETPEEMAAYIHDINGYNDSSEPIQVWYGNEVIIRHEEAYCFPRTLEQALALKDEHWPRLAELWQAAVAGTPLPENTAKDSRFVRLKIFHIDLNQDPELTRDKWHAPYRVLCEEHESGAVPLSDFPVYFAKTVDLTATT